MRTFDIFCENFLGYLVLFDLSAMDDGPSVKEHVFSRPFLWEEKFKKIYIFTTLFLGEKIKNISFSRPFFGKENKNFIFTTIGGEKIKILFYVHDHFSGRKIQKLHDLFGGEKIKS